MEILQRAREKSFGVHYNRIARDRAAGRYRDIVFIGNRKSPSFLAHARRARHAYARGKKSA